MGNADRSGSELQAGRTGRAIPFARLKGGAWQNLALLALAVFYVAQFGLDIYWRNTCGHLAIDYCAFWSAGRVAATSGYARAYDLGRLEAVQRTVFPPRYALAGAFATVPSPYLPPFIAPFALLSGLSPFTGYWLWTLANLAVFLGYLSFFLKRVAGAPPGGRLLALAALSLPAFLNFFNGQINVWLMVCAGEALRAGLAGRRFRAGLWLGGLLLKPQLLVLIAAALLVRGAFRLFAGLACSGLALFGLSWLMAGRQGLESLARLWLGYSEGLPTNDVAIMMNWRMVGDAIGRIDARAGWAVIVAGSAMTLLAALYLSRRRRGGTPQDAAVVWLGLLAASTVFAWHSHVHTAIILLPAMLCLVMTGRMAQGALAAWVFAPAGLYVAAFLGGALWQAALLPPGAIAYLDLARGSGQLATSIYLVVWAIRRLRQPKPAALASPA